MKLVSYFVFFFIILMPCLSFNDSSLVKNLRSDPNNAKFVYDLYKYYDDNSMFTDELLVMWRYLIISDDKEKSKQALDVFCKRLYTVPAEDKDQKISLSRENMVTSRSFNLTMELIFGVDKNKILNDKNKNKSFMKKNIQFFTSYIKMLTGIFKDKKKDEYEGNFAVSYFMPYFVELEDENYIEPFVYKIFSSYDTDEIKSWLKDNESDMQEFLEWSKNYKWK
jgi:hypothetical protein